MNSLLLHEERWMISSVQKQSIKWKDLLKIFFVILGNVTFYMRVHESNSSDS